ncbi:hypothetical protein ACVIWU_006739 [Bradyrhizobium sp. USDA 4509]
MSRYGHLSDQQLQEVITKNRWSVEQAQKSVHSIESGDFPPAAREAHIETALKTIRDLEAEYLGLVEEQRRRP